MNRKLFPSLLLALVIAAGIANAQTVTRLCVQTANSSSGITVYSCQDVSATNPLPVTTSSTVGATVTPVPSTTSGGTLWNAVSTASTNATSVVVGAHNWLGGKALNTTGTVAYLRLYNLATAPSCASATGFVGTIPVPASASVAGTDMGVGLFGANFSLGIAFCVTGGGSSTDNTNGPAGVYFVGTYK